MLSIQVFRKRFCDPGLDPGFDVTDKFLDLGSFDRAMIIQPGGYHLMFVGTKGHVGAQESIFFGVTKK